MSRPPEVDRLIRDCSEAYVVGPEGYAWRGCARRLAAEVERLEKENFTLQWEPAKLKTRVETAEALVAELEAHVAELKALREQDRSERIAIMEVANIAAEAAEALLKQTEAIAAQRMQSCATMLARAEAAEARVKELEAQLKGTMQAGGYEHFTAQVRNAKEQAHNAIYVAQQLEKKVAELEARAEQQQEALQAAAQVFEWLDNVEWPQSECDAFHGNAGSCPIDYSQAQQAVNSALNHDQETNT